jgi:hypothetical protein
VVQLPYQLDRIEAVRTAAALAAAPLLTIALAAEWGKYPPAILRSNSAERVIGHSTWFVCDERRYTLTEIRPARVIRKSR